MAHPYRRSNVAWYFAFPVILIIRMLCRIRSRGHEKVPASGGVLILANHLSYVDVHAIQLSCPRPIRFVGHDEIPARNGFFYLVFRFAGVITVSRSNALSTVRKVVHALEKGEAVVLFPEGAISRTGQLMRIERGYEIMARKANVPVLPVAVDGPWDSYFSHANGSPLARPPFTGRIPIKVVWGDPIPPNRADHGSVRRALLDLGAEAFAERAVLRGHLGREVVRQLAHRPWSLKVVDCALGRREFSSGMLLAISAALAGHLRRTVPEMRVGIVLPPGGGSIVANLAIVCAGKVPVNLNFTTGRAALESSFQVAGIKTVLTVDTVRARLPDFPWPAQTLDLTEEIARIGGSRAVLPWLLAAWVLPGSWIAGLLGLPKVGDGAEAGLLFTSGSSGVPKGVVLSHRNILGNCEQISSLAILPDSAVMLASLPPFHSFGFTVTLWYPLLRGCKVVTVPSPLDARKMADTIRDEAVTVLVGAPTFLRPLLRKASPGDLRTLDLAISGAEKLPPELDAAFREKFHLGIMQGYGLTETSPVSNVNQPDPPMPTETDEVDRQRGSRAGSVGRLMPGMTARLLDPATMAELPPGATGLLVLRGSNIFSGYLGDEAKTRAAFHDGWFVTGDLGRFDEDGFLFIEGRLSRFSKIGGEMVAHGTVEQTLGKSLGLDPADGHAVVVMGVPDAGKGEALVLLTTRDLSVETVREKLLAAGLTNLWIPKIIQRVERIPVLGTGKLDLSGCQLLATEARQSAKE